MLQKSLKAHARIIFNGNGYDDAWIEEAERRGLSNLVSTADALPMYYSEKNVALFTKHGIYTREELEARAEIHVENYTKVTMIEAGTMIDMLRHEILPAVSSYSDQLCQRAFHKSSMGMPSGYETSTARDISELTDALFEVCERMEQDLEQLPEDAMDAMVYSHNVIIADMQEARQLADKLETLTAGSCWPFPVYSDLLFCV